MLKIETSIYPFRLKLSDKKPVQLKVNIRNMNDEDVLLSYDVLTSKVLSITTGSAKHGVYSSIPTTKISPSKPLLRRWDSGRNRFLTKLLNAKPELPPRYSSETPNLYNTFIF